MQDKPLFNQFIAFCESQPENKEIDHYTWETCAVGDFGRYLGKDMTDCLSIPFADEVLLEVGLINVIGNTLCPSTYGEFTKFLKEYV